VIKEDPPGTYLREDEALAINCALARFDHSASRHETVDARVAELESLLRNLRKGMIAWAADEDWTVHPDAAEAFNAASRALGLAELSEDGSVDEEVAL